MSFDWLYQEISASISNLFHIWYYTVLIMGAFGLIAGIILVTILRHKKAFQRPYSLWTFVAKLNYLYTPACFAALFGLFGAIYGVQHRVDRLLDYSANSISASGTEMLPLIDTLAPHLNAAADLDDAIYGFLEKESSGGYFENQVLGFIIKHYTYMVLNELGYPSTVEGVRQMAQENNFKAPTEGLIQKLPSAAKAYCGVFFSRAYLNAFLEVLPYLLIPVAEFALFWLISSRFEKDEGDGYLFEEEQEVYV